MPNGLCFSHHDFCCLEYLAPDKGQGSVLGSDVSKTTLPFVPVVVGGGVKTHDVAFEKIKYEMPEDTTYKSIPTIANAKTFLFLNNSIFLSFF